MTLLESQDLQDRSTGLACSNVPGKTIFPKCLTILYAHGWKQRADAFSAAMSVEHFMEIISRNSNTDIPSFLPDLARLEWAVHDLSRSNPETLTAPEKLALNPTLRMLETSWTNLSLIFDHPENLSKTPPEPGQEILLVWRNPFTGRVGIQAATPEDLLMIKMIVEHIDSKTVASMGSLPVGAVDAAIERAVSKGIILAPPSKIRRDPTQYTITEKTDSAFVSPSVFTLQWHVTQACDLHCKHCYDRSSRSVPTVEQGIAVLDDLRAFCRQRHVRGQVSFTGGNPLLYRHFTALYEAAVDRGLAVAILGNPTGKEVMKELVAIERPAFFQVSLEGLENHNDLIRGPGHFARVLDFLEVLKDLSIPSKVMLTLTRANLDQVLALAALLRDRTDDFTFNRLSMVGEGANLQLPEKDDYMSFLNTYMDASANNPVMRWKDNLLNIAGDKKGLAPFGGCTGYGCGAAFNFLALLSDGEVHACRKFPSPIGNAYQQSFSEIYDSELAKQYRRGPEACLDCRLRLVCRGCLAVAFSHGLDIFKDHDPYCFI